MTSEVKEGSSRAVAGGTGVNGLSLSFSKIQYLTFSHQMRLL